MTALIIGSMVPDFEYFIRMRNISVYSHTWLGLFWYDLPLGILLCFLFHYIVKKPLIANLPYFLQQRFMRYADFHWNTYFNKRWITVILCVFIGAVSHLVWDRITHKSYHLVTVTPGVKYSVYFFYHPQRVYTIIHTIHSVIGMAMILFAVWRLPVDRKAALNKINAFYWVSTGCIAAVISSIIIMDKSNVPQDYVVAVISGVLFAVITTSFILSINKTLLPSILKWKS